MDLQDELNSLPVTMQKTSEVLCPTCHRTYKQTLTYKLKIDVLGYDHFGEYQHRYKIYYYCPESWSNKYIGIPTGIGHLKLIDAINELKKLLECEE